MTDQPKPNLDQLVNGLANEALDHFIDRYDDTLDHIANELIEGQGLDLDAMSEEEACEEYEKAFTAGINLVLEKMLNA